MNFTLKTQLTYKQQPSNILKIQHSLINIDPTIRCAHVFYIRGVFSKDIKTQFKVI